MTIADLYWNNISISYAPEAMRLLTAQPLRSERLKANKLRLWEGFMAHDIAAIQLNSPHGSLTAAEGWLRHAIDTDTARGLRWFLARDLTLCSELSRRCGDLAGAEAHLRRTIALYGECGADGHRERAERALGSLLGAARGAT